MDRFEYIEACLFEGERYLKREKNVKIYDGDDKTEYVDGEIVLTTHRILWGKPGNIPKGLLCLSLNLCYIFCIEEEFGGVFGLGGRKRIVLHLKPSLEGKRPGPAVARIHDFIKFSFKDGLHTQFYTALTDATAAKAWEKIGPLANPPIVPLPYGTHRPSEIPVTSKIRSGIVGIERSIEEQHKATDESISVAFQDLNKLMEKAKDMVSISKTISSKIREKQGDISEDDTIRFKSYLMSLGIDDPVTRDAYRSDSDYYMGLSQEVSDMLVAALMDCGGIMSLADVWCRVNRARGLELISPEDLLNACKAAAPGPHWNFAPGATAPDYRICRLLQRIGAPMTLHQFPSGARVLRLHTHRDEQVAKETAELLEEHSVLNASQLSQLAGVSTALARERLLTAESLGLACRDDSIEGLAFYPNRFLAET